MMFSVDSFTPSEKWSYTAEISELQIGGFPNIISFSPQQRKMGNGLPFYPSKTERNTDGDIMWVKYKQALGVVEITIFND